MRFRLRNLALAVICLLLLGGGSALAYLVNPVELQSFANRLAKETGGCGGVRFREAVLDSLQERSLKSQNSKRVVTTNELPARVIAHRFAVHNGEYEKMDLLTVNLLMGLRVWTMESLVSQETLVDALCANGASGRTKGSLADVASILGVTLSQDTRDCELRAVARVFVGFGSNRRDLRLQEEYQTQKAQLCAG